MANISNSGTVNFTLGESDWEEDINWKKLKSIPAVVVAVVAVVFIDFFWVRRQKESVSDIFFLMCRMRRKQRIRTGTP